MLNVSNQTGLRVAPEKRLADITSRMLAEGSQELGITYSGFCLTSLPHKRLADEAIWQRTSGRFTMLVEPGRLRINRALQLHGVPYGSRARLILIYLQTRAIQTNSPEIELGRSMRSWMQRMGVADSGRNYTLVRDQANRISACKLTFFWEEGDREGFSKDSIVKEGLRLKASAQDDTQGDFWEERVRLGDTFFRTLQSYPVPVWEPALKAIANQSLTIDVYIWLAYRLPTLLQPVHLTWAALHGQFGAGYKHIYQFKPRFMAALEAALTVYPQARVDTDCLSGLALHPSRSPVERRTLVALPGTDPAS